MQVKHVAGIGFAARRAAQQQRQFAVGGGLLGQVVVDAERVAAFLVHEVFGHRGTRVRGDVLQRRGVGGAGGDDDGVIHRAAFLQALDDGRDRRFLLADGDVHADHAGAFLIDDGVDGDGGLAGLAVADDQFALAAADGDHGVDGLDAELQRHFHRLAQGDAGSVVLNRPALIAAVDRAFAVQRPADRIDHAADQRMSAGNLQDAAGALDLIAFFEVVVAAHDRAADVVFFKIQRQAVDAGGKLDHFAGHAMSQPVDARDAVADFHNGAHFFHLQRRIVILDLLAQNPDHLIDLNAHELQMSPCYVKLRSLYQFHRTSPATV